MQWLSILPPLLAICVVFWRKEVILALFIALFSAELLLLLNQTHSSLWLTPINTIEQIVATASSAGNTRILLFSILVGGLLALIRDSGGVSATVDKLTRIGLAKSKRQVGGITMFTGIAVFIESNLSVLTSGILARGLFDKFKMSRARLAYVIDSTSAPVCILILLNGWGAFILSLVSQYELGQSPVTIVWGTIPFNFYALIALTLVVYTIISDRVHGPMREEESLASSTNTELTAAPASKARFMIVPLLVMVFSMIGFMLWTGNGELAQGSGSKSVLYATTFALLVSYGMLLWSRHYSHTEALSVAFKGFGELLPLVTILLLSMALGNSLKALGTGAFVASLVGDHLPLFTIPAMLFLAGALMSFATGTSWGTFAILIPIGMPIVQSLGLPAELVLAAILAGGVFGDHCSPISDTTAVSSIAAGCDLLVHVKTQLPYALFGGILSFFAFLISGLLMT